MIFRGAFLKFSSKLAGLVGLMALVACGAVAQDRLTGFLGADVIEIISTADRVEPFLLKPSLMPTGATGPGAVAGYEWKARGADLAPAQMAAFKGLVLDEASYDFEAAKKCVMVPEYVFRFHAGEKSADVLVAFGCTMWAFGSNEKVEDFDPVTANLRAIVETVFKLD
ncbi:MAG: hypothetical protein HN403_16535 [Rhodospirillales bacterium]|jgi:hypothetical protein|nr:hypothetical protein [Rhodospirillales bacterium]